jgi:hypothetical protein
MKKTIIISLIIIFLIPFSVYCNPVEPPPIITEVYFDENDSWILEFYIDANFYEGMVNLDSLRINTAILKQEAFVQFDVAIIITPDMLIGDLEFTRESGHLYVETYIDGWIMLDWGIYWNTTHPPLPGQSIALQYASEWSMEYTSYWPCHSYPPSLGENVYNTNGKGTFEGYIYDLNLTPIPNVTFYYYEWYYPMGIIFNSNDSGYFSVDILSRMQSSYISFYIDDPEYTGSIENVWVEIDSTFYVEIIAPVYITGINENKMESITLKNFPNPVSDIVNFKINIPYNQEYNNGEIVICDISGSVIDNIILDKTDGNNNKFKLKWIPPANVKGVLIYYLKLDNRLFASNKMIIL